MTESPCIDLFVPGRLCLFGEHTDWAGGYRTQNPALEKGYTLSVGTNQGLFATVKPHPSHLILQACLDNGQRTSWQVPMKPQALLTEAQSGSFLSYAAGVAYQLLTHFPAEVRGGVEIDNHHTTLPIQKGLSSSAAICVLVARAFSQLYDLNLTLRDEMEWAYQGEITTPSQCGRLDQSCAYGNRPVMMIFDGPAVEVVELAPAQDLFFVIVDLAAHKDTRTILQQLNQAYPVAQTPIHQTVQAYLGGISTELTHQGAIAVQQGDGEQLGALMTQAQAAFDHHLQPACPDQLTAPVLHKVLNHAPLQPYIWGGKGVGSQGDGTAQFVVKDAACQQQVIDLIQQDFPAMHCLKLVIQANSEFPSHPILAG